LEERQEKLYIDLCVLRRFVVIFFPGTEASACRLALTGLRAQYPQTGEADLRFKLAGLLFGDDLRRKAYGEPGPGKAA
jgi:hypothetical protein